MANSAEPFLPGGSTALAVAVVNPANVESVVQEVATSLAPASGVPLTVVSTSESVKFSLQAKPCDGPIDVRIAVTASSTGFDVQAYSSGLLQTI